MLGNILRTLAFSAFVRHETNNVLADNIITSDEAFFGLSPPIYPASVEPGSSGWEDAFSKARALVGQMTLDEKVVSSVLKRCGTNSLTRFGQVNITGGISMSNLCSGHIPQIPRLNFSDLCLNDRPSGLRSTNILSSWSTAISVGATAYKQLDSQCSLGMASEFKTKGVNVALGKVIGPLGRIASWGGGFSNDPYLAGVLVNENVNGMQSAAAITSTKVSDGRSEYSATAVSSNVDDNMMHELYLWPFQDAVRAGTGSIMCSYQRINNSYGRANSKNPNGLLKTELGFQVHNP
ncbi:glycosyl hydrolase family 3 N terminal domain-containing protein [Pseudomassariella vexata]|uniref:beta-glucosidase n=1 Tax=Pseudomassariella vexata TaxID=1141098 RepID=A0A1Y2EIV8_9PEZI|nr:glycosyl hydrolase family 3 N terminal domain-containing protein [Pseudomassariella vexata]ORY71522.1 glycosyl hydrolase family 3 N terminal domain-domain-containing protein [Pseudomassariella vexata]